MRQTIAVDFDGVLHSYTTPWEDPFTIPDPPVPGAMEWLLAVAEHYEVVIHTTRARSASGIMAVYRWLQRHWTSPEGPPKDLIITAQKMHAMVYLDDRGLRFNGTFPTLEQLAALAGTWNRPK